MARFLFHLLFLGRECIMFSGSQGGVEDMALTKEDLLAIGELIQQSEQQINTRMDNGFERVEQLINIAAADAAKTEKRLNKHLEEPHIS